MVSNPFDLYESEFTKQQNLRTYTNPTVAITPVHLSLCPPVPLCGTQNLHRIVFGCSDCRQNGGKRNRSEAQQEKE